MKIETSVAPKDYAPIAYPVITGWGNDAALKKAASMANVDVQEKEMSCAMAAVSVGRVTRIIVAHRDFVQIQMTIVRIILAQFVRIMRIVWMGIAR